ncbi:MAG: PEP-CTERM sorting domain-containing protein, partial [Planctomycetes bacterium]|nr:PEP-CTERM sorting domain-containing protein [Planctomycetota bacterium]
IDASGPDIKLEVLPFDARVLDGGEADIGGGLTTAASQEIELAGPTATILSSASGSSSLLNDGSLSGTGRVETLFNNRDGGQVNAINDTLTFTEQVSAAGGSELNAINSTVVFEQGLDSDGAVNLIDSTFDGDLINNGSVSLAGVNTITGNVSGTGEFTGTGTALLTGSSSPGNSPGVLDFEGDLIYADTHTLLIELGSSGGAPGVDFDQINVEGLLEIDGGLDVHLLDGFSPGVGDSFLVLTGGETTGTFAGLGEGEVVTSMNGVDLRITYAGGDGNDIALTAIPEPGSLALLAIGGLALIRKRRR